MEGFGGELRRCSIYVDEYAMPRWEELPRLYEEWCGLVLDCEKYKDASTKERARIARWLHDFFLCIHPFEDGNGRTARLVLNMLRLRYGLPWLIIEHKDRLVYYREIKQLQESVFKAHYPDVYPADGLGELTEA